MIQIKNEFLPIGKKRTGKTMKPTTITIHNTGNPKSTARNERDYLSNPTNTSATGYHLVIDQRECICAIPLNEVAFHSGTEAGNYSSIGIEICEAGDFGLTYKNAVGLIADLLYQRKWDISHLRQHKDWSGKECPRLLIPIWSTFLKDIKHEMDQIVSRETPIKNVPVADHWAEKHFTSLNKKGIKINEQRFNDSVTRGEMFALLDQILK